MSYVAFAHDAVSVGLSALATVALFASFPAAASEPDQVRVAYSDLDLTSDAGQATLNNRIRNAVKRVCAPVTPSASSYLEHKACKRAAYAGARSQMQIAVARAGERKALATSLAFADPRGGSR
jgi:UrcA family protein